MNGAGYMARAIEIARLAIQTPDGTPFAAVVVRDGEIIAEGCNRCFPDCDPTAHGEIVAIREACRRLGTMDLSGCEIYSTAEPCPMCAGAIWWSKIDSVFYAADEGDFRRCGISITPLTDSIAAPARARPGWRRLEAAAGHELFNEWLLKPWREEQIKSWT